LKLYHPAGTVNFTPAPVFVQNSDSGSCSGENLRLPRSSLRLRDHLWYKYLFEQFCSVLDPQPHWLCT